MNDSGIDNLKKTDDFSSSLSLSSVPCNKQHSPKTCQKINETISRNEANNLKPVIQDVEILLNQLKQLCNQNNKSDNDQSIPNVMQTQHKQQSTQQQQTSSIPLIAATLAEQLLAVARIDTPSVLNNKEQINFDFQGQQQPTNM